MAFDYPDAFFEPSLVTFDAPAPSAAAIAEAANALRHAKRPLIVAGGGVLYGLATDALRVFADAHGIPVAETQAGKSALPWDHPLQQGAIGVTGSPAANALAADADVVLAIGTRLSDFTTGSHSLFAQARLVNLNVNAFDARKWRGLEVVGDAKAGLEALAQALRGWTSDAGWLARAKAGATAWRDDIARLTGQRDVALPYDGDVIGAVQRSSAQSTTNDIVVCAAGTLPAGVAQALAHVGARRLSHGVRLLVHGLRDRRRPGREDGAPRSRGHRDGGRRQLPDAQCRDRDLGGARPQARDRDPRQPWLRLHQPPAAGGGWRAVQQPLRRRHRRATARRASTLRRMPPRWARAPST